MISKSAFSQGARLALRQHGASSLAQRRGLAAAASAGSASYQTADVAGIKVTSRDTHDPTTKLAVVAKAGTRYETSPGLTAGLEEYAFKNTAKRSALRIQRESELLGGQLKAYHTREALVLEASFLRSDLPYFAELLGEVITSTRFTTHELAEEIDPVLPMKQAKYSGDAAALALDAAHSVAFHSGLGAPLYPSMSTPIGSYLNEHSVATFAAAAYTQSNVALVADGANPEILGKWTEKFFNGVPASSSTKLSSPVSTYFGGEQRTALAHGNAMVLAFSGSSKPELAVLAALLGGSSSISWSPGFTLLSKISATTGATASASNLTYSDAGLFTIQLSGSASAVRTAATEAINALKAVSGSVSKEDLTKAIAKAKFDAAFEKSRSASVLAAGVAALSGKPAGSLSLDGVTAEQVKAAAKGLLEGKASVAAVGDLFVLPYAADLGLKV